MKIFLIIAGLIVFFIIWIVFYIKDSEDDYMIWWNSLNSKERQFLLIKYYHGLAYPTLKMIEMMFQAEGRDR